MGDFGRNIIKIDETEINASNVVAILHKTLLKHEENRRRIQFLWDYYRGKQPILNRVKEIRPEICNTIVENRANEIVSFKSGYLLGEPMQYVSRGNKDVTDEINLLNEYVFAEEKATKDKELADWFHICGTSYRMVLPDEEGDTDECPFEIYTLDPRFAYVVYHNGLSEKPVLGVKYVINEDGSKVFSCYSETDYFEIKDYNLVHREPHYLGEIPIIEYPLNTARLGSFETVVPLLDAINTIDSNRVDGIERFIQALMLIHNVNLSTEQYDELRLRGAIKFIDIDPTMRGDIQYLTNTLNQAETQTVVDSMYQTVLTICGMPSQADGSNSDSSNNGAVILRNGWQSAEARAKDSELMFKRSERKFLKIVLNICKHLVGLDLKLSNIEIRFTRRNYENIYRKAQVLDLLLNNPKVADRLGFEHCGLFVDSDLAYTLSREEYEANQEKAIEREMNNADGRDAEGNREVATEGLQSGAGD